MELVFEVKLNQIITIIYISRILLYKKYRQVQFRKLTSILYLRFSFSLA